MSVVFRTTVAESDMEEGREQSILPLKNEHEANSKEKRLVFG